MPRRQSERLAPKKILSHRHIHDPPCYGSRRRRARVSGRGAETSLTRQERIRGYLEQLAFATLETSQNLRLLPLFLALLGPAPGTIVELMSTNVSMMKRVFVFRSSS
jgi:hypothetical protein